MGAMNARVQRVEALRQAIAEAFAEVPYPGDDAIVDDPTGYPGSHILENFKVRHWRDLPDAHCWVAFLNPAAQRFYLPGLMMREIPRLPLGEGPNDFLNLVPPEDSARYAREREAYPQAQREAVRLFLEYGRDEAKSTETVKLARLALQRYWGPPEEHRQRPLESLSSIALQAERVKETIRRAFADVPYPGDDAISVPAYRDEEIEVVRDFKGYGAREIPRAILCYHYSSLPYLTPSALRFFLQSYVLAAFDCNDNLIDFTVYSLDPTSDDPHLYEWSKSRFAVFRAEERHAVRAFLEYASNEALDTDSRIAQRALEAYWAHDPPPA